MLSLFSCHHGGKGFVLVISLECLHFCCCCQCCGCWLNLHLVQRTKEGEDKGRRERTAKGQRGITLTPTYSVQSKPGIFHSFFSFLLWSTCRVLHGMGEPLRKKGRFCWAMIVVNHILPPLLCHGKQRKENKKKEQKKDEKKGMFSTSLHSPPSLSWRSGTSRNERLLWSESAISRVSEKGNKNQERTPKAGEA